MEKINKLEAIIRQELGDEAKYLLVVINDPSERVGISVGNLTIVDQLLTSKFILNKAIYILSQNIQENNF